MKKNIKIIYLLEIIMTLLVAFILLYIKTTNKVVELEMLLIILFSFFSIITIFIFGFFKDKNYLKSSIIRIIVVLLLSTFLIINGLGLILGFKKNVFNYSFFNIFKIILPIIVLIFSQEIIRYVFAKQLIDDKRPIIFLTIIYLFLDIFIGAKFYNLYNFEQLFKLICIIIFPAIAKELLASYLIFKVGLKPVIIYRLGTELYVYLVPVIPNLGEFVTSVVFVLLPYLTFVYVNKVILQAEKANKYVKKISKRFILTPIIIFLVVLVILVSGVFSHKLIAIGSDSMKPIYKRGDAVIYQKVKASQVNEGDILVFEYNQIIVTHRVINKFEKDGKLFFKTKGDNNKHEDKDIIVEYDVLGKVKYTVPEIGYPTVMLNEIFSRKR